MGILKRHAKITVQRVPMERLHAHECRPRYADMVMTYVDQLRNYPHDDAGLIRTVPCPLYEGLLDVQDGYHRYCASIIAGRPDMRCIIIEEPEEDAEQELQGVVR